MDTGLYCVKDRLKSQTSPLSVGRGTPCPLKWSRIRSSRPGHARRSETHHLRTSSAVGSRQARQRARGCSCSYCACSARAIASIAFCACGSIQHSNRAHGDGLVTSGGSTPMLSAITSTRPDVFIRSRIRHGGTSASGQPSPGHPPSGRCSSMQCSCCIPPAPTPGTAAAALGSAGSSPAHSAKPKPATISPLGGPVPQFRSARPQRTANTKGRSHYYETRRAQGA